jgi:cation diffusion facilitator CzcD-associated flavoprotein CzcO
LSLIRKHNIQALFQGTVLHSGEYDCPDEWQGKKGIVVGTANTGKFH